MKTQNKVVEKEPPIVRQKLKAALNLLQDAQKLTGYAAQELRSVDGCSREWEAVSDLYETIKSTWHEVNHSA